MQREPQQQEVLERNEARTHHRWFWPAAVFTGSLLLYLINNGGPPHPDELYHVLAARGLLATGEPTIAEGLYDRVYLHTWLIARFFGWFGESLPVARLPSALAMAGAAAVLFAWLRQVGGPRAALLGAGLFAVSPFAVDIAQLVRFYGLQTLAFLGGALLVYAAVERAERRRWTTVVPALSLFAFAVYLQTTSLIGIAGILVWLALRLGGHWLASDPAKARTRGILIGVLGAVLTALTLALFASGALEPLWGLYRHTSFFNRSDADNFVYYQFWYTLYYPALWPLIALLSLTAIAWRPRPAFFVTVVFLVVFVLSSFAASKGLRYIIYVQPFLFALFGMAIARVWKPMGAFLADLRRRLESALPLPDSTSRKLAGAAVGASVALLVLANPAFFRTVALLADIEVPPEEKSVRWELAAPTLGPLLDRSEVVVTMAELEMLYYFDRYDILLSRSRLGEIPDGVDFSPDFRTGRPVIGSIEAMRSVLECYATGVLVTNARRWGSNRFVSGELATLIERSTESVPMPTGSRVIAFAWSNDEDEVPRPPACEDLPDPGGPSGAVAARSRDDRATF